MSFRRCTAWRRMLRDWSMGGVTGKSAADSEASLNTDEPLLTSMRPASTRRTRTVGSGRTRATEKKWAASMATSPGACTTAWKSPRKVMDLSVAVKRTPSDVA